MTTENLNKTNGIGFDLKNKVTNVEDQIGRMAHNAGRSVGNTIASFSDKASEQVESGRDYVKNNPVKGVAIAAAAGVVVGSLMTMAMRRNNSRP